MAMLASLCGCQTNQKKDSDSKDKTKSEVPKLTKPSVRKVWVPAQIEDDGRTYRDGHFIYILQKETTWSQ
jgi:hypothetical protein